MSAAEFRNLLEAADVNGLRAYWAQVMPGMPQPADRDAAEASMHMARTQSEVISFTARAYSHRWLDERDLPSQLPDHLKPRAERLYPKVVTAVGISVNASSALMAPAMAEVQREMELAVEDCYANGDTDPAIVKRQMTLAQDKARKVLLGAPLNGLRR